MRAAYNVSCALTASCSCHPSPPHIPDLRPYPSFPTMHGSFRKMCTFLNLILIHVNTPPPIHAPCAYADSTLSLAHSIPMSLAGLLAYRWWPLFVAMRFIFGNKSQTQMHRDKPNASGSNSNQAFAQPNLQTSLAEIVNVLPAALLVAPLQLSPTRHDIPHHHDPHWDIPHHHPQSLVPPAPQSRPFVVAAVASTHPGRATLVVCGRQLLRGPWVYFGSVCSGTGC